MSRTEIAKHAGHLCVGAALLTFGTTAGATVGAVSAINLAALWRDMKSACVPTAQKAATRATLAALTDSREFSDDTLATAATLLAHPPAAVTFQPDDAVALLADDTFVEEITTRLLTAFAPDDDAIETILRLAFTAALTACLATEDFRTSLRWDIDLSTLQAVHRLETLFGNALRLAQERADLGDGQIIQMAKRLSPNVQTREEAIAALDQVVAATQRVAARGAIKSNHPDFIDQVFAEVARLNADNRPDEAAQAIETALAEEREASTARQRALLDGLRDQHIVRQDSSGLADAELAILRLDHDAEIDVLNGVYKHFEHHQAIGRDHGTAFDLRVAVELMKRCEALTNKRERRAIAQINLGNALRTLGERGDDHALRDAVAAYHAAMEVHTRDAMPELWARTQDNLGNILKAVGSRGDGKALEDAITAYRAALEVRTRDALPMDWATTQNNLGAALLIQGQRGDDDALRDAVTTFRTALEVHTRDALPDVWAMTQTNLGTALQTLDARGHDDALRGAVTAYRAALEVHTRDAMPVQWAMTLNNLGGALQTLGERGNNDALRDAVAAYRAALEVRTRDALPLDWAMTQMNLGNALAALGQRGDDDALRGAVTAYRAALEVRTRDAMPVQWAMTRANQAICFGALAKAEPDNAETHLAAAHAAIDDALTVMTEDAAPAFHAQAIRIRDSLEAPSD